MNRSFTRLLAAASLGTAAAAAQSGEALPLGVQAAPRAVPTATPDSLAAALDSAEEAEALAPALVGRPEPHSSLLYQTEGDALWVRGRGYKASASADGFTFHPFLGITAERGYPLGFRLAQVTSGGVDVALEARGEVSREGDRFVIDRGVVDARYDLALDFVEQSFTIEEGALSGELVLELALDTELVGTPKGGGLRFDGPEGGVNYGAAIAFDEAGERVDVPMELDGSSLRLVVPASFVEGAVGDITVDPVVDSFTVNDDTTYSYLEPDVTYDRTNNVFLYVYEELFTTSDVDLYYTVTDSFGAFLSEGYVLIGPENCSDPEAANLAVSDQCLVVCSRTLPAGGSEIVGRIYDATLDSFGASFRIFANADETLEQRRPDVGGGALADPNSQFMVCWSAEQADGDIDVNLVTVAQDGTLGTRFRAEVTTNTIKNEVVVGASLGTDPVDAFWPMVWRQEDRATGGVTLRGFRINDLGNSTLGGVFEVFTPASGNDLTDIDVSSPLAIGGVAPTYLVSYDIDNGTDEDIFLLVCREDERRNRIELALIEHGPRERNQLMARLSTTREDFVVTYLEQRPGTLITDPYLSVVDLIEEDFLGVSEQRTQIGTGGALFSGGAAPASRYDSGLTTSRVNAIAWSRFETIGGNSSWNTYGVRHSGFNPAIAGPQYCFGNPNSTGERGFLAIQGTNSTTDAKTLAAFRLPPNQFGLFAVSNAPDFQPVVPNSSGVLCLGGAIGRYNAQIAQADANGELSIVIDPTALPTPFGTEAAVAGTFRQFQLWHRDANGGGATSNFTNAVSVFFR